MIMICVLAWFCFTVKSNGEQSSIAVCFRCFRAPLCFGTDQRKSLHLSQIVCVNVL